MHPFTRRVGYQDIWFPVLGDKIGIKYIFHIAVVERRIVNTIIGSIELGIYDGFWDQFNTHNLLRFFRINRALVPVPVEGQRPNRPFGYPPYLGPPCTAHALGWVGLVEAFRANFKSQFPLTAILSMASSINRAPL